MHALTPPPGVRELDLLETVEGYLALLLRRGAGGALTTQPLQERAREYVAILQARVRQQLCHNDVHHLNVVDAGGLRLIDWEYAGVGQTAFDLASVCVYQGYTEAHRTALLNAYVEAGGDAPGGRLEIALWLFEYVRDLWMACREASAHQ